MTNNDLKKFHHQLIDWEHPDKPLAPLNGIQRDIIEELSEEFNQIHIPTELPTGDFNSDEEDNTNIDPTEAQIVSSFNKLGFKRVATNREMLQWCEIVEQEIDKELDSKYIEYSKQLGDRREECLILLHQVEQSLDDLDKLTQHYQSVSHKTNSLHQISEQLLADQVKLHSISDEINGHMQYFSALPGYIARLSSPTLSVASEQFAELLDKLDTSIEYLEKHSATWREAKSYLARYRQCINRAIEMMKTHVSNGLNHAALQAIPAGASHTHSGDTAFALCYGKFQAAAIRLKPVIAMIEIRVEKIPEYNFLLNECQNLYFTQRESLLSGGIDMALTELAATHKGDHSALFRSACAFLVHLSHDEYQLYHQFFSQTGPHLTLYLERICTKLYDILRPDLIHMNHSETLAEVCSILRLEMLDEHVHNNPAPLEAFGRVAYQLLQDVQERLVFRTQSYLRSDILNYNAAPGDLAYPEKLEMMESIAQSLHEQSFTGGPLRRSESRSSIASIGSATSQEVAKLTGSIDPPRSRTGNSAADLHGLWYPPVRRTLVCLSRLYRCVERTIFQGLSQEALSLCIQSISKAADMITSNKTGIDGELFQIKHLLILREQIAPFQVDFTVKEMSLDFSHVRTAAFGLIQKRKRLLSLSADNALLEFLVEGAPQVKEQLLDSRKEVDRQLKYSCECFISHATKCLLGPLQVLLSKIIPGTLLKNNPATTPEKFAKAVLECQRLIKTKVPSLQRSMQLYLSNRDTETILFRPIKNNVAATFGQLAQTLTAGGFTADDLMIVACPTSEQASLMMSALALQLPERKTSTATLPENSAT